MYRLFFTALLLFNTAAAEEQLVKIGAIAGLSGEYSAVFQNWIQGITLAHESYTAQGKMPAVKLLVEDDEFHPNKGLAAYKKLTEIDGIDALINGSTPTITSITPIVRKTTLPVIQFGEEAQDPEDDNILQIMPGNIEIERALGRAVREKYPRAAVLIHSAHPTFNRFAEAFKEGYAASVEEHEIDLEERDFRSLLTKIVARKPTVITLLVVPEQGALIIKELWKLNQTDIPFAFDGSFDAGFEEYRRLLGTIEPLDSALLANFITRSSPEFLHSYKKRFGEEPGIGSDLGYDAFTMLMENYDTDPGIWLARLKKAQFDGISGHVEFDDVGIRRPEYEIQTVLGYRRIKNQDELL